MDGVSESMQGGFGGIDYFLMANGILGKRSDGELLFLKLIDAIVGFLFFAQLFRNIH